MSFIRKCNKSSTHKVLGQYLCNLRYNVDMRKKVNQLEPVREAETTVAKNGAVRDLATGRIVAGPMLSHDQARGMVASRVAKKRAAVQASALEAVQSGYLRGKYGDEAWIAEVTQAQMTLATTPDAGKASTIAAEWLINNSGMGERQAEVEAQQTVTHTLDPEVVALLQQIAHAQGQEAAIEAVVLDDDGI
jgi:hypothetical protein